MTLVAKFENINVQYLIIEINGVVFVQSSVPEAIVPSIHVQ